MAACYLLDLKLGFSFFFFYHHQNLLWLMIFFIVETTTPHQISLMIWSLSCRVYLLYQNLDLGL